MYSWDKFTNVLLIKVRITLMHFILCFVNRYQRTENTNKKVFCPKILFGTNILKDWLFRLLYGNFGTFHSNIFALILVGIPIFPFLINQEHSIVCLRKGRTLPIFLILDFYQTLIEQMRYVPRIFWNLVFFLFRLLW
jgi:hypothetical protein